MTGTKSEYISPRLIRETMDVSAGTVDAGQSSMSGAGSILTQE